MKPGIQKWATNANYAAGPDAGQPTKAELAVGLVQDGYYSQRAVAPDFWNMFRWRLSERIDNLSQARLKNMSAKITPAVAGWAYTGGATTLKCKFTSTYNETASTLRDHDYMEGYCNLSGAGVGSQLERIYSYDRGEKWSNFTATLAPNTFYPDDICAAYPTVAAGGGYAICGVDSAPGPGLYRVPRAQGRAGVEVVWDPIARNYRSIDTSYAETGVDVWCAYVSGAGLSVQRAVTFGGALAPAAGLGALLGGAGAIRYSHHPSGKLYPSDLGNDVWMLATQGGGIGLGNIATSVDNGANFLIVNAAAPAIINQNLLAYSAWGARWGIIEWTATFPTFAYSDDNGVTWTSLVDGFGFSNLNYFAVHSGREARLVCDGYGHWMCAFTVNYTDPLYGPMEEAQVFYSADNGENWLRTNPPIPSVINTLAAGAAFGHDLWYADGAFWYVICFDDGAGNDVYYVFSTLRTAE